MNLFTEKIISFFIGLFTLGIYPFVIRGTHKNMIELNCNKYKEISYKDFKKLFDTVQWKAMSNFKSLEYSYPNNQFHASIVEINDIGYLFTSYGFIRATCLKNKTYNKLKSCNL